MIKCNWEEDINDKLIFDHLSNSWKATDLSISQSDEAVGSLEFSTPMSRAVCTCRTIELFSSRGYLKSVRGNIFEDETYKLHEYELDSGTVKELERVKFLSNSNSPKSTIYFKELVIVSRAKAARQSNQINTEAVRELLKDLPHNEESSSSVLAMMDSMPPLFNMMLPTNNTLSLQLAEAINCRKSNQCSNSEAVPANSDVENTRNLGVKTCGTTDLDKDQNKMDISSIMGSIGSLEDIVSLTNAFKNNKFGGLSDSTRLPTVPSSEISKILSGQKEIKADISKLREELNETKSELLRAITESESRMNRVLLHVLDEMKSLHSS